jgi:CheY-like chemotaxis protein
MAKKTILFVEDEPQWIERLKDDLGANFNIRVATNLKDASETLETTPHLSAIVLDLMLPAGKEVDAGEPFAGLKFLEHLKAAKRPDVPVIVYSSYLSELRDEIGKLGAQSYISKSEVSPRALPELIKEVIEKHEKETARREEEEKMVSSIKRVVAEEIERYAPVRERTIHVPGQGNFELIKPLIGFKRDIERQISRFPFEQSVFLMMKFRGSNRELSEFIVESLGKHGLLGVRADHDEWNITRNIYNPIAVLYCCKYGIALFDEPEEHQAYSANVAYELGMVHYQNKDCLILKHASLPQVPFDLIKDLYVEYEKDLNVRPIIQTWIRQVSGRGSG